MQSQPTSDFQVAKMGSHLRLENYLEEHALMMIELSLVHEKQAYSGLAMSCPFDLSPLLAAKCLGVEGWKML